MSMDEALEEAVEVLQELGLREYEAQCFVGLSRLSNGTAKQVSEVTDVPRTRVYDAVRVLEAQGLVEIQHSSPQRFRAVPLAEAVETLRDRYEARVERLVTALERAEPVEPTGEEPVQEVWSMSGREAIGNRAGQLIEAGTEEVVLVLGDDSLLTADLTDTMNGLGPEVELIVGAVSEELEGRVREAVPGATTFVSGLDWLRNEGTPDENLAIGRLLLVDRSELLVSTIVPGTGEEQAIFGGGFQNGLVVISRRLLAQGLADSRDPNSG